VRAARLRRAMRRALAFLSSLAAATLAAGADAPKENQPRGVSVTPVFGQLVQRSFPLEFRPAFEKISGGFYVNEAVLAAETVDHWTQLIRLTGMQGLAANAAVTPAKLLERLARAFNRHCPTSYSLTPVPNVAAEGVDSYGAVVSCGSIEDAGGAHSESALIVAFKGQQDYYTVQWAERGPASAAPLTPDLALWRKRFSRLAPIRLCPIFAGETEPYASCLGNGAAAAPAAPAPTPDQHR
jgi:hypothetical protein